MRRNLQTVERSDYQEDGSLSVVGIWHTIQGEGPLGGHPAVFVRLAGCNLQCPGCDTDYTVGRVTMSVREIFDKVQEVSPSEKSIVVITGGEPFRQNIAPLAQMLFQEGAYLVQIETNGLMHVEKFPWLRTTIVCSPKTPHLHAEMLERINHLKYVLKAGEVDPKDGLPTKTLGGGRPMRPWMRRMSVYVSPMDEQDEELNKANVKAAVESCMTHGYILSLQTHKYINVK